MRPAVHVFQLYRRAGEEQVWWRYISPNGRSVASCVGPLPSLAGARASIDQVVTSAGDGEITVRPTPDHRWRWTLNLGGEVIARGSGDNDRRLRCLRAAEKFVQTVATAEVDPAVHTFRRRGPVSRVAEAVG